MEYEPEALLQLRQRVAHWADRLSLRPRRIRIQRRLMKKWGSCSTTGTVTLTADLVACEKNFQDVVIVHELLHLRVRNHGKLFRALMTAHVPHWRATSNETDHIRLADVFSRGFDANSTGGPGH